jgi:hypothetical protein
MKNLYQIVYRTFTKNKKIHNLMKHRETFRKPKKVIPEISNIPKFSNTFLQNSEELLKTLTEISQKDFTTDITDFTEQLYEDCINNFNNMLYILRFINKNEKTLRGLPHNLVIRIMQKHLDIIETHVKFYEQVVSYF